MREPPFLHLEIDAHRLPANSLLHWRNIHSDVIRALLLIPVLLLLLTYQPTSTVFIFCLSAVTVALWQWLFSRWQDRPVGVDLIVTTLLFTLLLPPGYVWWQLILGVSFGVVIGEQIYGGRGYSFVHPVIAGLAFLFFSFDNPVSNVDAVALDAALLMALACLLYLRLVDWRVVTGLAFGIVATQFALWHTLPTTLPSSVVIAGAVFGVSDPAVSTATRQGRWALGVLVSVCLVLLDPTLNSVNAIVYAALLGSVTAPLIDWVVLRFHSTRQTHA